MSHSLEETQKWEVAVAARAKFKDMPENFLVYRFAWLGDMDDKQSCIMEVTGSVFRRAKSGPRKGQLCMMVPKTERKVYLTPTELDALKDD